MKKHPKQNPEIMSSSRPVAEQMFSTHRFKTESIALKLQENIQLLHFYQVRLWFSEQPNCHIPLERLAEIKGFDLTDVMMESRDNPVFLRDYEICDECHIGLDVRVSEGGRLRDENDVLRPPVRLVRDAHEHPHIFCAGCDDAVEETTLVTISAVVKESEDDEGDGMPLDEVITTVNHLEENDEAVL